MNIVDPTRERATVPGLDSRRIPHRELARVGYASENQDMPERLTVTDRKSRNPGRWG